jgi:predicted phage-related endonuclease
MGVLWALIGGNELVISPDIDRNDRFIALLAEKEAQSMDQVHKGVPPLPDGSQSAPNTLQDLYPEENGQTIELPASVVEWNRELQEIKEQLKELTSRRDRIESAASSKVRVSEFHRAARHISGKNFSYPAQVRKFGLIPVTRSVCRIS